MTQIQFLGTSSGMPSKCRNVSGVAIQRGDTKNWCLVDCGEGTQHQILHTRLSLHALQAIFITHVHGDHCYGLPGLLASAATCGRREPLTIVGPVGVRAFVEATFHHTLLQLNYPIEFLDVESDFSAELTCDFDVHSVPLSHRVPSFAYVFTAEARKHRLDCELLERLGVPKGELWGQLQQGQRVALSDGRWLEGAACWLVGERPQKVIIAGDNDRPELLLQAAQGADVLVHEATYTQKVFDRVGLGPQHSSAAMVANFAEAARIPNLVLTHFSVRYHGGRSDGDSLSEVEDEAKQAYSGSLFLAEDLAAYRLDKEGRLSRMA